MAKKLGTLKCKKLFLGVDSGGRGTEVTSSAAELNVMDGVTATADELNYVDVTPGSCVINKALVLDGSYDVGKMGTLTANYVNSFISTTSKQLQVAVGDSYSTGVPSFALKGVSAVGTATDAATFVIQTNVPVGCKIMGCQLIVMTAFKAGDTWDAAYSTGATQTIASAQAVDLNTTVEVFFDENAATSIVATNPCDITITKNGGGSFATPFGAIVGWVYYQKFVAPGAYS